MGYPGGYFPIQADHRRPAPRPESAGSKGGGSGQRPGAQQDGRNRHAGYRTGRVNVPATSRIEAVAAPKRRCNVYRFRTSRKTSPI
jgi:hypothetical protein